MIQQSAIELSPTENANSLVPLVLKVGVLAAFVSTIASALLVALLSASGPIVGTSSPGVLDIARTTLLLCPITAVACGFFGFLGGLAGGGILALRRKQMQSTRRLLIESAIIGLILGSVFPFYDELVNRWAYLNRTQIFLSAPAGALCALACAFAFRGRFISERR